MRKQGRMAVAVWVLLALSSLAEGDRALNERTLAAGRQEADLVAPVLAEELVVLHEQIAQLQAQIEELTVQLAEKQLQADRREVLRAKMATPDGSFSGEAGTGYLAVAEVSRDLALVVLEGGRVDGLKTGLMLAVLRGDEVVAQVRVVDVREKISGARIVKVLGDGYPQPGNRAVVWRTSME